MRVYEPPQTCVDAIARKPDEGYVMDCFIIGREGEALFGVDANGILAPRLMGYAILPIEEYEELVAKTENK